MFNLDRNFNLARKFQSRRLDFTTKIGPRWVARSKISFSLENFNLAQNLDFFWSLGPLSLCESMVRIVQKILGKASDDSLLLKDFLGPQENVFGVLSSTLLHDIFILFASFGDLKNYHDSNRRDSQCAAKGGTRKGVGHFFLFRSPFGKTFLVPFLPIAFCLPPFCGRVRQDFTPPGNRGIFTRFEGRSPYWIAQSTWRRRRKIHWESSKLRWPGDSQRESGRFTRIDSRESIRRKKKKLFS